MYTTPDEQGITSHTVNIQIYTQPSPKTDFYLFDMSSRGKIIQIEFRFKPEKSKIGLSVPDWN